MDFMKENKEIKQNTAYNINPDGAVKRGYLKENIRVFSLNNIENADIPPHYHEFHKIIFFSGGRLKYNIEGSTYRLLPGDILVIPAYNIHQPVIGENVAYRRTVIWISTAAAESLGIADMFSVPGIRGRDAETAPADPLIREVILYINDNLSEDLSIERLCERFFISKTRLIARFREITGTTPHQYIKQKRIILAARYMEEKNNAAQAGSKAGFSDYSAFYRAFVKEYGISPRDY
ncbi:MAG: helix-turn-helix domain-containing protein [Lachnospiraceae bacterium]|nr:helix-turn-helix domain-containing protein [Candidatus Darwinimomas equi]